MIALPSAATPPASVAADLSSVGAKLKATSPADTVAYAFGKGRDVWAWYDESDGQYFDLASLTKPLFTAPTVLRQLAALDALDEPVGTILSGLPDASTTPTARQLLTHSAGLPAELPAKGDLAEVRAWVAAAVAAAEYDFVTYSDVGYWLLGELVSTVGGGSLPVLFSKAPTAAADAFMFGHAPASQAVPAGPVLGNKQLVHDGAARRLGLSGHAGVFGTLGGVVYAVVTWLDPDWLPEPVAAATMECQTHAIPGGHRSLAWTLAGDPYHVVAHDWPPTTLCHTGFTGVSVALDPVSQWWAVYLTNALPVAGDAVPIQRARRLYHASVAAYLRSATHDPAPSTI